MYLLDTNTAIYFFKDMGQVAGRLLSHPPDQIAIPTVVIYELETGIAKSTQPEKRRAQLDELLAPSRYYPSAWPMPKPPRRCAPPWRRRDVHWGLWIT